jgi:hypothetical protein
MNSLPINYSKIFLAWVDESAMWLRIGEMEL